MEQFLKRSTHEGIIDVTIRFVLDYLLTRRNDGSRKVLYDLGAIPQIFDEYEVASTTKAANIVESTSNEDVLQTKTRF